MPEGRQSESAAAERRQSELGNQKLSKEGPDMVLTTGKAAGASSKTSLKKEEDVQRKAHKINGCIGTAGRAENNKIEVMD